MPRPTVRHLLGELIGTLDETLGEWMNQPPILAYNTEEVLSIITQSSSFPLAIVMYEGTQTLEGNQATTKQGQAVPRGGDTALYERVFDIIIAADYNWGSNADESTPIITDLLDLVRGRLQGYVGVNGRPWRFAEEGPVDIPASGVILYAQVWKTTCVEVGNS